MEPEVKLIKVVCKDLYVYVVLGERPIDTYTVDALDKEIRENPFHTGYILPDQDIIKKYDNYQGLGVDSLEIRSDSDLRNAMKYCPGSILVIFVDTIFPLSALTPRIQQLKERLSSTQADLNSIRVRVLTLKLGYQSMHERLQKINDRLSNLEFLDVELNVQN